MAVNERHGWMLPSNLKVGDTLIYRVRDDNQKHKPFIRKVVVKYRLEDRFVAETERGNKYYIGSWNASDFELQRSNL